ncbi:MAG TPA: DUF4386 domain-containing protein [Rhizomicrobium sp.]|nr:DUF4386 domain-containing protein [Rhizomicrobium sp.]
MRAPWSPQTLARWIGILLLVSLVAGGFGEAYVPAKIMVASDADATAKNIVVFQHLFRHGYLGYVIEGLCDAALTALLYCLLRPAGRELALVALMVRIVATCAFAAAESWYFGALAIVNGAAALNAFSPGQLDALALLSLKMYSSAGVVPTLFYGVGWVLLGRLVFVSGYLPKWLGVVMAVAGISFVAGMLAIIVAPAVSSPFFLLPMIAAMLVLALWLLVRGVDMDKWQEKTAIPAAA